MRVAFDLGEVAAPAPTYTAHRQRLMAAHFPAAIAVVVAVIVAYVVADARNLASRGQLVSYLLELAVPLLALALAWGGALAGRVEMVTLGADLAFTAVLAGRLLLPSTTVSGTALFLSLKLLATALLFAWRPGFQFLSATATLLMYYGIVAATEQHADQTHQLVGPAIAAVLSCAGAVSTDRTRRTLWQQSVHLNAAFAGLATSETRYRELFERSTDLIFAVDEAGPLRLANQAALDFVGVSAERLQTLRWQELVCEASRRQLERRIAIVARRPALASSTFEIEVQGPAGEPAVLELRARLVSGAGQPRTYHCIARNVTERRRHERATQELLVKLREANQLQAEFVANMSHELRTPLNVIIGYADLLADDPALPAASDGRVFLERIAASGRALHRLVESVLEYARLDRGHHVLVAERFAATTLLGELRALCDDVSTSPRVTIAIDDASDLELATDYDRLYSILSNLLLNAIKFTPHGTVELHLRRLDDGVEFIVRDTGIGIEPAALAHVFEPFRQVDGSPTRSFGGVGLGLAIVRRNTELLGGRVEVESEVGAGSTFRVRIPRMLEASADTARTPTAA